MDDSELIEAFRGGDDTAFAELVRRYRSQVYRVARGILRSHEAADEAAQDAFVKAHRGLGRFAGASSFKTWMYRIAMNTAYDIRAREAREARVRADAGREALAARPIAPDALALESLSRERQAEAVREAMTHLPETQRMTLVLRVHDGLAYAEIAETLGCPVGTVKANIHHAVQNLRKILARAEGAPAVARAERAAT